MDGFLMSWKGAWVRHELDGRDGFFGFSFKDRPLILNTAGAIPGTMRETLFITSDSEVATTATPSRRCGAK